jgi:UDP-N-acetylglucosamine--N-acetylmuramyl-(pentapeptide) pyrophosphoryl-undecaprenol N-acetylglucosamine transferase
MPKENPGRIVELNQEIIPMQSPKFIVSGGGTGGHIFPAIAIADALKQMHPEAEFLFVGAKGRMEMERVPKAGYPIKGLWISGIQRRLTIENLSFPFKLLSSLWNARKIVKSFKPHAVVGVGGYASGPLLQAAVWGKVPTLIQEQNSYPGITNKLLASKVNTICVAYEGMEKWFPGNKIVMTGNPVRSGLSDTRLKRQEAADYFKLDPNRKTVLVVGGSLGARTINQVIEKNIERLAQADVQVIWQTGKSYANQAENLVSNYVSRGIRTHVFIDRMDLAYGIADVVVSRAGAMSVSELCLVERPCILVPSPNVAEDHQTKNAMALVQKNAALMVPDAKADDDLIDTLIGLINDEEKCSELAANIKQLAKPQAAQTIAKEVLKLVKN